MMPQASYRYLDRPEKVAEFAAGLGGEDRFALDLEADSLHSYREKVCLAQVTTCRETAVLDAVIGREGLAALGPVLADPAVEKVLHGADYDIRLLKKDLGFRIRGVFDTMVAAQLAGRERVGLAALLEAEFGVRLDKKYPRADGSARPLSPEQLEYAALDTAHLLALRDLLDAELRGLGRDGWAREEFLLLEKAEPAPERGPRCLDVKGAGRLNPRELAALQALLEVREEAARQWDRPPFKVLSPDVLLTWAQKPPTSASELRETRGVGGSVVGKLGPEILDALHRARLLPEHECPRWDPVRRDPLDTVQERRLKRLKKARAARAEALGIEVGLLVNSASLERLAREEPVRAREEVLGSVLKGWQMEAVGGDLRSALAE